jgi:hypothetical protein
MDLQDPEPPRKVLKKLALESATPPSGDVTISDTPYKTSDEAHLCLLRQNDDLEAEYNHLCQQLNHSPNTQQIQVERTYSVDGQNLANRPYDRQAASIGSQGQTNDAPDNSKVTVRSGYSQSTPRDYSGRSPATPSRDHGADQWGTWSISPPM